MVFGLATVQISGVQISEGQLYWSWTNKTANKGKLNGSMLRPQL